ncbi:sensor histidine kinase [Verrucosispora sp. WMMD703]|uniref:sensor histidine kinase n=1 Tax=Verrucosispora sp. WMMD703 TaxID=3403463 RepID=UPI003B93D48B
MSIGRRSTPLHEAGARLDGEAASRGEGAGPDAAAAPVRGLVGRLRRRFVEARQGWIDARAMATLPGLDRALRFVAVLLFAQRASYLLPAASSLGSTGATHYRSPALNLTMVTVVVAWNAILAVAVWRRGWFTIRHVLVDIAVTCVLLFVANANLRDGFELSAANWMAKFALGTAALAGAVLSVSRMLVALAVLLLAAVAAIALRTGGLPPLESGFLNHVNSSLWFALLLHFMRRYLAAQADAVDAATARRITAETAAAASQARFAERLRQFRHLHDTVLATLTAISRGGLDHRTEAVRARCGRDADYVRRLIAEERPEQTTSLGARLTEAAEAADALGLRVHLLIGELPDDIPDRIVDGIGDATREALNNVARHAGTGRAWVSADWTDRTLTVRIVDRGLGFTPDRATSGSGLRRSIKQRMREVGGSAQVFSDPGDGTCVELVWDG